HGARLAYGSPRPVEAIVYDVYSTTDPYHNKDRNAVYTYDRPAQNQPTDLQAVIPSHRSSTQANFGSWGNAVNGGACLTGPGGCTGGEVTSFGGMADMTLWPASPFGDPFANPFVEAPVPTQNSEAKWNQWPFLMVPAGSALSSPQAAAPSALLAPTTISLQGLTTGFDANYENTDTRVAVATDNCGTAVHHTRVPDHVLAAAPTSLYGSGSAPNLADVAAGAEDADHGFVSYVNRNAPGMQYVSDAFNLGIASSSMISAGGKIIGKVLTVPMAIFSGAMYYANNRSQGMGMATSFLNASGNAALDVGYAIPGVIDAGLRQVGFDVNLTTTFKNGFDAIFACPTRGLDAYVDDMMSGKRGKLTQRLANFYYKLGNSDIGGKIYQGVEDSITAGKKLVNRAYQKAKGVLRSVVQSRPVQAVTNFIGSLLGGGK
ncbi:MAG: hypothetical protein D6761_09085, partial [Candidatus Dadabacteria bacterium]